MRRDGHRRAAPHAQAERDFLMGRVLVYGIYPLAVLLITFRLGEALYWHITKLL